MSLLKLTDVGMLYGGRVPALEHINLTVEKGDWLAVMGPSGSGKTTLMNIIGCMDKHTSGEVILDGINLNEVSKNELTQIRRDKIGMVFQQFNLLSNRTVAGNVAFPLEIAGWPADKIAARVAECLEIVGLSERSGHYPAQLSGGQKQRVGIARALAPRPSVILADEPTSALDPITTRSVLACLREINERFQVTIVIVTHEMAVIRKLCHRTALLHQGKLLEVAEVKDGVILAQSEIGRELLRDD